MSDTPATERPPAAPSSGKAWMLIPVLLLLGGGYLWWNQPHEVARYAARQLAEADRLAKRGDVDEAAGLYRSLAAEKSGKAEEALAQFRELLAKPLDEAPLAKARVVMQTAASWDEHAELRDGLADRALELARARGDDEPHAGVATLELVSQLEGGCRSTAACWKSLLKRWADKHPDDPAVVTAYCIPLHDRGQLAECEKRLAPLRDKLGITEGAVVLASARTASGNLADADALLGPVLDRYLPAWETAAQTCVLSRARSRKSCSKKSTPGLRRPFATSNTGRKRTRRRRKGFAASTWHGRWARTPNFARPSSGSGRTSGPPWRPAPSGWPTWTGPGCRRCRPAAGREQEGREAARGTRSPVGEQPGACQPPGAHPVLDGRREGRQRAAAETAGRRATLGGRPAPGGRVAGGGEGNRRGRPAPGRGLRQEKDPAYKELLAFQRSRITPDVAERITWLGKSSKPSPGCWVAWRWTAPSWPWSEGGRRKPRGTCAAPQALRGAKDNPDMLRECGLTWLLLFRATGEKAALTKGLEVLEEARKLAPRDLRFIYRAAEKLQEAALRDVVIDSIDLLASAPRSPSATTWRSSIPTAPAVTNCTRNS